MPAASQDRTSAAILLVLLRLDAFHSFPPTVQAALRAIRTDGTIDAYDAVMEIDDRFPEAGVDEAWTQAENEYHRHERGLDTPETAPASAGRRVVNIGFTYPYSREPLDRGLHLAAGMPYDLTVGIGAPAPWSISEDPPPFPGDLLPPGPDGHWLKVVLTSPDFTVVEPASWMFLPQWGPSFVCGCRAGDQHTCGEKRRGPHLFIRVLTPPEQGPARMRLSIYAASRIVQELEVFAYIDGAETAGEPQRATTAFTLTAQMSDLDAIAALPPPLLAIGVSPGGYGGTELRITDEHRPVRLSVPENQMQSLLSHGRRLLDEATGGDLREHLSKLAIFGRTALVTLIGDPALRQALRSILDRPGVIQIAQGGSPNYTVPWALLYDIPIQTGNTGTHRFCAIVDDLIRLAGEPVADCPYVSDHRDGIICPFGFWGFRHLIEVPPSARDGMPLWVRAAGQPRMVIGYGDITYWKMHALSLSQSIPDVMMVPYHHRDDLLAAIQHDEFSLVYCYCHCEHDTADGGSPYLDFGGPGNRLDPVDLAALDQVDFPHWTKNSPLVFINGCRTGGPTLDSWLGFVQAFAGMGAAGVIGTDVRVKSVLAAEAATRFWTLWRSGKTAGESLRAVRVELLIQGELAGLAYTAYCPAHLRMAPSHP